MVTIERSDRDPRGYRLTTELLVEESREQVFAFFSDAFQLEIITPPWLKFSVLTPPPIELKAGTLIDYGLRLRGLPLRWRSQISRWRPPICFVDEQIRGPYRYWHHLHTFDEVDGGTLVRDIVHYAVPLDCLAHRFVRSDLTRIFQFRRDVMSRIFSVRNGSLPDQWTPIRVGSNPLSNHCRSAGSSR